MWPEPWEGNDFIGVVARLQAQREDAARSRVAAADAVMLFDRSSLCTLALARYLRRPVPASLAAEIDRINRQQIYQRQVFLVQPLGFVVPSAARRISHADSLFFHAVHEEVYREHGFDLIDVPAAAVIERVALVDQHLRGLAGPHA